MSESSPTGRQTASASSPFPLASFEVVVGYNSWANQRLADAVADLPAEAYRRELGEGHRSVRGTVEHLVQVEEFFLARCARQPVPTASKTLAHPADASKCWRRLGPQAQGVLQALSEKGLTRTVEMGGGIPPVPLWVALLQMVMHGIHHRGQVSAALRRLGLEPPQIDYIWYHLVEDK